MPAGDVVGPDGLGILRQLAELQPVVAPHARIGRAAAVVFVDEIIDHPAEIFLKIQDVKRNIEQPRHAPGIGRIEHRAASLLVLPAGIAGRSFFAAPRPAGVPSRMNTPITSYPSRSNSAAATELSTPPLMATTTFFRCALMAQQIIRFLAAEIV